MNLTYFIIIFFFLTLVLVIAFSIFVIWMIMGGSREKQADPFIPLSEVKQDELAEYMRSVNGDDRFNSPEPVPFNPEHHNPEPEDDSLETDFSEGLI